MLLDRVHPSFTFTTSPRSIMESIDDELDEIICLNAFPIIPPDYLYVYLMCGYVNFRSEIEGRTINIDLMSPVESHELYFDIMDCEDIMPGMYPIANTGGAHYIFYGKINERSGVYIYDKVILSKDEGIFVAATLSDIVFQGIGLDILRKHI